MVFQKWMSITQQLKSLYNMTVYENKSIIALNVTKLLVLWYTNMCQSLANALDDLSRAIYLECETFYIFFNSLLKFLIDLEWIPFMVWIRVVSVSCLYSITRLNRKCLNRIYWMKWKLYQLWNFSFLYLCFF